MRTGCRSERAAGVGDYVAGRGIAPIRPFVGTFEDATAPRGSPSGHLGPVANLGREQAGSTASGS